MEWRKIHLCRGDEYEGLWKNSKCVGFGIYQRSDGTMFKEEWEEGKQHSADKC